MGHPVMVTTVGSLNDDNRMVTELWIGEGVESVADSVRLAGTDFSRWFAARMGRYPWLILKFSPLKFFFILLLR